MPGKLDGKVCVVNGAASPIGQAVADRLICDDAAVVVGVDKVEHTVGEQAIRADLTKEPEVEAMYRDIVREHSRIDVIYNNMGLMARGDRSVLEMSLTTWHDLAIHLARSGVRVNAVLFGPIETPQQKAILERDPGILDNTSSTGHGRYGTLDEAAGTIAFLAGDDAGFITGAAIALDGGITEAFTVPEGPQR